MKDTLGILIAAIVAILLIVILPLVSIMDNQDNMAYNTVLTQATNYIDSVRTTGYIEKDEYETFLAKLSRTGNLYEIDLEVYKPILVPDTVAGDTVYVEDKIMDNKQDIEDSIKLNGHYKLDVGDEIYISIANTNIPSSSVIYKFVAGVSKYKIVDISYGGIVTKIESKKYDHSTDVLDYIPQIVMGLPRNKFNDIDITRLTYITETLVEDESGNMVPTELKDYGYQYIFDITDETNNVIKIPVVLKNFETFGGYSTLTVNTLKEYIALNGFTCGAKGDEYAIQDDNDGGAIKDAEQELNAVNGEYRFSIVLSNIRMESTGGNVSISIAPRLGTNEEGGITYYSSGKDTVTFYLINDYNKYACEIVGPYNELGEAIPKDASNKVNAFIGQDIYFNINYKSIGFDGVSSLIDVIKAKLDLNVGGTLTGDMDTYTLLDHLNGGYEISEAEINEELNYGTIKVKLKYSGSPGSTVETKLFLPDGWIDYTTYGVMAYNQGTAIEVGSVTSKYPLNSLEREERGYYIKPDDEAPKGNLTVLLKRDDVWQDALAYKVSSTLTRYLVDSSAIRLDTKNITDGDGHGGIGSGLSKALLRNDTTIDYSEKHLEGATENKYFSWEVKQSLPNNNVTTEVEYILKDRANNPKDITTVTPNKLQVYYEINAPKVKITATNTDKLGTETETYVDGATVWYNKPIYIHLSLEDPSSYVFPYTLTLSSTNTKDSSRTREKVTGSINPATSTVKSIKDYLGDDKSGAIYLEEGSWDFTGECLTTLNHTSATRQYRFNIDRTGPTIYINDDSEKGTVGYDTSPKVPYRDEAGNDWVRSVTHYFIINDYLSVEDRNGERHETGSGLDKVSYYITEDGVKQDGTEKEITNRSVLTGGYKISDITYNKMRMVVTATDKAGNESKFETNPYNYDNTEPVINAERDINDKNRIKVTISDAHSGVVKKAQGATMPDLMYFKFTNEGSSDPAVIPQEEEAEKESFNSGDYLIWDATKNELLKDENGNNMYKIENQIAADDGKSFEFEIVNVSGEEFKDFMWLYVPDNVNNWQINKCSVFEQPKIVVTQTYGGRYKDTFSGVDSNLDEAVNNWINRGKRLDYGHIFNLDFTIENAAVKESNTSAATDTSNRYTKVQYAFVTTNYTSGDQITEWSQPITWGTYRSDERTIKTGIYDKVINQDVTTSSGSAYLWIRVNTRKEENGKIQYVYKEIPIKMTNEMRIIGGAISSINSGNLTYFNAPKLGSYMYKGTTRPKITQLIVSIPNGSNGTSKTNYGYDEKERCADYGWVDNKWGIPVYQCIRHENYFNKSLYAFTSNGIQYVLLKKNTWRSDRDPLGTDSVNSHSNRKDIFRINNEDVSFSGSPSTDIIFDNNNSDNWGGILIVPTSLKPGDNNWKGNASASILATLAN